MRLINFVVGATLGLFLLTGCKGNGGNDTKVIVTSPNPPVVKSYGIFRNLKATVPMAPLAQASSVNQSVTMSYAREGHKALMLDDGRIMLIGGEVLDAGLFPDHSIADFYDPINERFTPSTTPSLIFHRYLSGNNFAMVKITNGLYSGKVLIVGGLNQGVGVMEFYDPATDTYDIPDNAKLLFNAGTAFTVEAAFYLGNDKMLLCGTHYFGEVVNKPFIILDMSSWTISEVSDSPSNFWAEYKQLPNGNVIAVSGLSGMNFTDVTDNGVYRFNISDFSVSKIGSINQARGGFGLVLLNGGNKIGIYGGMIGRITSVVATSSVEVFDFNTNTSINSTNLIASRYFQSSILLQNGFVLNAGGCDFDGHTVDTEFVHNPTSGESGSTGTLITPRRFYSAVTLNNGTVLISGGETRVGDKLNTAEIYDPQSKIVVSFTTDHVSVGRTLQFTSSYVNGVDWSCNTGSISATGLFTPSTTGSVKIKATAKDNSSLFAEVEITVE
jgi:hypothetical protein